MAPNSKNSFGLFLFGAVIIVGIFIALQTDGSEPQQIDAETLSACTIDSDCIPHPEYCHPTSCINREFENLFERPEFCTEIYSYSAAYSAEDCLCVDGTCVNKNLDRQPEDDIEGANPIETITLEQEFCEESGGFFIEGFTIDGETSYCLFEETSSYCRATEFMSGDCHVGEEYYECAAEGTFSEGYYDAFNGDLLGWADCG